MFHNPYNHSNHTSFLDSVRENFNKNLASILKNN